MNRVARRSGVAATALVGLLLVACTRDAASPQEIATPTDAAPAPASQPAPASPATAAAPTAAPALDAAALIGRTMPPYPAGLDEIQGICIGDADAPTRPCGHGLAALGVRNADGTARASWLVANRNRQPDADLPNWEILDAVALPLAADGYDLQLGDCRIDGREQTGIAVLVRHGESEYSRDIRWARHFDPAVGRIVELDVSRVDCPNYALGV